MTVTNILFFLLWEDNMRRKELSYSHYLIPGSDSNTLLIRSFYAKKSFTNGLFIVGQVANDHIRNETPIAASVDFEDALRTDNSWWWALKLGFRF